MSVAGPVPGYTHVVALSHAHPAPTTELEEEFLRAGHKHVAGVDEVGRGSWAGPVVAAAVVLPLGDRDALARLSTVRDSKQLSATERSECFELITHVALAVGIGWSSHHSIDRIGIAAANRRAMIRAVSGLALRPDALLVDYFRLPESDLPQVCIPKGDSRSLSIAAASIVAKTVRDRWISRCEARFSGYGFASHKGYGTSAHREAIHRLGMCSLHRLSFRLAGNEAQ